MDKCYLCNKELTGENRTLEHVLPNGIGGRLTSYDLICRTCNSIYGETIDADFVKQFLPISSMLQIKRQRGGPVPPLKNLSTGSGEKYDIVDGRKPVLSHPIVKLEKDDSGLTKLHITARHDAEMRKKLTELSKKYKLDVENAMQHVERSSGYMAKPINMGFKIGGPNQERAIAKVAVSYFLYNGGNAQEVGHVIPFIKGEVESPLVNPYLTMDDFVEHGKEDVFHVLHITGSPDDRRLFAYVQIYSCFSYVVSLSTNYKGKKVNATYCINPATGAPKSVDLKITPPPELVSDKHCSNYNIPEIAQDKLKRLFKMIEKRHTEQHLHEKIEDIYDTFFNGKPEGYLMTELDIKLLSEKVSMWFVEYYSSRTPKPGT